MTFCNTGNLATQLKKFSCVSLLQKKQQSHNPSLHQIHFPHTKIYFPIWHFVCYFAQTLCRLFRYLYLIQWMFTFTLACYAVTFDWYFQQTILRCFLLYFRNTILRRLFAYFQHNTLCRVFCEYHVVFSQICSKYYTVIFAHIFDILCRFLDILCYFIFLIFRHYVIFSDMFYILYYSMSFFSCFRQTYYYYCYLYL